VKAAYEKYKSKGFNVVGLSFDNKLENWKKAIADMQLDWVHLSDLKGWQSEAGQVYGIRAIPASYLVDPTGKIIAAVQSTLDIDGKTAKSATFIRLLELDPQTGNTRMLAYPLEAGFYKKNKDAKIGDLVAVDEQTLLVIEQGKDKDKQMHNRIYRLDLTQGTDLSGQLIANKALEYADADALQAAGVVPVGKQLLVDLQSLGWSAEKAEGLTLVDSKTLAVTSDNDFGLGVKVKEKVGDAKDPTDYSTDGSGKLLLEGKPVASSLSFKPLTGEGASSALWLISLDQPLR
jgi:alkyl hydroperoxide reductase subunit AhpC